jgi:hypothetical protein
VQKTSRQQVGGNMSIDQCLSATLDLISLWGFLVVIIQLRDSNRQTKLNSQIRLLDVNRELISLGFSKPELFKVLNDGKNVDPDIETFYLQLWLNQFCIFEALSKSAGFERDVRDSLEVDFRDMMGMENMRRHWRKFGKFYPASFQEVVNQILNEAGYDITDASAGAATP